MSRRTLVFLLAGTALGAAACGSSSSPAPGASSPAKGPAAQAGASPGPAASTGSLPMDAYTQTSAQDDKVVQQAFQITIRECMKRYGFDYQAPAPDPASANRAPVHTGFGLDDPKLAATWGYHSPQAAPQPAAAAPAAGSDPDKNSPQQLVLVGDVSSSGGLSVPQGGCKGEAERKILGDSLTADMSVLDGPRGTQKGADPTPGGPAGHDPRVQAALTAWSACMKGQGYQYTTPDQPLVAFLKKPGGTGAQPSATESSSAVADATCKQQTHLNGAWMAAETDVEKTFIEQHAAELAQVKKLRDDEVKRAAAIAGSGS